MLKITTQTLKWGYKKKKTWVIKKSYSKACEFAFARLWKLSAEPLAVRQPPKTKRLSSTGRRYFLFITVCSGWWFSCLVRIVTLGSWVPTTRRAPQFRISLRKRIGSVICIVKKNGIDLIFPLRCFPDTWHWQSTHRPFGYTTEFVLTLFLHLYSVLTVNSPTIHFCKLKTRRLRRPGFPEPKVELAFPIRFNVKLSSEGYTKHKFNIWP